MAGARHDPLVALRLIYQMFAKLLGWIVLCTRSDTSKDIEILVLRHLRGSRTRPGSLTCSFQAATSYSLMSPPRTGRRRILP